MDMILTIDSKNDAHPAACRCSFSGLYFLIGAIKCLCINGCGLTSVDPVRKKGPLDCEVISHSVNVDEGHCKALMIASGLFRARDHCDMVCVTMAN